jgi:hypothetical protein
MSNAVSPLQALCMGITVARMDAERDLEWGGIAGEIAPAGQ